MNCTMRRVVRLLGLCLSLGFGFAFLISLFPLSPCVADGIAEARPSRTGADRVVFLGSGLTPEELVLLTAAVTAGGHPGVVLYDSPQAKAANEAFVEAFRPERIIPVGEFPGG